MGVLNYRLVEAAFDPIEHRKFVDRPYAFRKGYDFDTYQKTLGSPEIPHDFPDDIRKIIAFLVQDGFFDFYHVSITDWLRRKDFNLPHEITDVGDSVIDMVSSGRVQELKESLLSLNWWDKTRGDPQGT
ncbi:MAG: hypothetical protein EOP56_19420 [Sphingobacteriales bacterium]|nr:MAG: hypothetical protein EOP56_19420 [Sphingobacteriales bacterium]